MTFEMKLDTPSHSQQISLLLLLILLKKKPIVKSVSRKSSEKENANANFIYLFIKNPFGDKFYSYIHFVLSPSPSFD